MNDLLHAYPVTITIPVAWGDMDAFQHVNNVTYFRYFESGRIAYLERLAVADFITTNGIGPILHSVNCRFRLPVTYPDMVHVGVRVTAMGEDRMVMDQCVVSARHNKVAAQGDAMIVTYDYGHGYKAPMPEAVRTAILALEATVGNEVATVMSEQARRTHS